MTHAPLTQQRKKKRKESWHWNSQHYHYKRSNCVVCKFRQRVVNQPRRASGLRCLYTVVNEKFNHCGTTASLKPLTYIAQWRYTTEHAGAGSFRSKRCRVGGSKPASLCPASCFELRWVDTLCRRSPPINYCTASLKRPYFSLSTYFAPRGYSLFRCLQTRLIVISTAQHARVRRSLENVGRAPAKTLEMALTRTGALRCSAQRSTTTLLAAAGFCALLRLALSRARTNNWTALWPRGRGYG